MDFVKMMEVRGINLEKLSEYEFMVLLHAISQEKERRARVKREQLIAEYTDKIDQLIEEISEKGLVVYYCGSPIDLQGFGSQLVVGSKDD
jgi:hypothetical protein